LRASDHRAILHLIHECRDRGDDPHVWRAHLLAALGKLVGADIAMGGEMAGIAAGRPVHLGAVEHGWENGFDKSYWEEGVREFAAGRVADPAFAHYLRAVAGTRRGASLTRVLGERGWRASPTYQLMFDPVRLDANLYAFHPVPGAADECDGLILARAARRRPFSARETAFVNEAQLLLSSSVGGPLARFAEPCPTALSPRAREVLRCLLEGDSDKQVAARLRLSPATVNEYTKRIYRHFRVTSRAELLARWVRRGWGAGPWAADR
ncbi:MAG TPA: helix-turn-helix transcriptional regulator, partial [Gemmataceae bacterium]|nr:helix-turn-helix transcriptional regulator [Gemmataceae bacterium]